MMFNLCSFELFIGEEQVLIVKFVNFQELFNFSTQIVNLQTAQSIA